MILFTSCFQEAVILQGLRQLKSWLPKTHWIHRWSWEFKIWIVLLFHGGRHLLLLGHRQQTCCSSRIGAEKWNWELCVCVCKSAFFLCLSDSMQLKKCCMKHCEKGEKRWKLHWMKQKFQTWISFAAWATRFTKPLNTHYQQWQHV